MALAAKRLAQTRVDDAQVVRVYDAVDQRSGFRPITRGLSANAIQLTASDDSLRLQIPIPESQPSDALRLQEPASDVLFGLTFV